MFHSMSLRAKLVWSFGLLSLFLAVVGGMSFYSSRFLTMSYDKAATEMLPKTFAVSEIRAIVQTMSRYAGHIANPQSSPEERKKAAKAIHDRYARYEAAEAKLGALPLSAAEHEAFESLQTNWKAERAVLDKITALDESTVPDDHLMLQKLAAHDLFDVMEKLNGTAAMFRKALDQAVEEQIAETQASANFYYRLNLIFAAVGIALSIVVSILLSAALGRRLKALADVFSGNVVQVAVEATQMASTSSDLSSAAAEQSATLQSTSSALHQIAQMVKQNAKNSSVSRELALAGETSVERSKHDVADMLEAIDDINRSNQRLFDQVNDSNQQIAEVVRIINDIGEKTKVINEIVFQTKLLSFNASVEAARAGEHGKGFAVVAEEVGSLASLSGSASREISEMLVSGTEKVRAIVANTQAQLSQITAESRAKIESGVSVADRCNTSLEEVVKHMNQIKDAVAQISVASVEQSEGVAEISRSVSELEKVTDQNNRLAQQSASSSDSLRGRSQELEQSLLNLRVMIDGSRAVRGANVTSIVRSTKAKADSDVRKAG